MSSRARLLTNCAQPDEHRAVECFVDSCELVVK